MSRASRSGFRVSRRLAAVVLILLGGVAAARLDPVYLPVWTFPELEAELSLPSSGEVDDLTRRWIVPLESAVRGLGGVRGHAGEVSPRGARLRVRFEPGIDAERKAARLESELQSLRRRLPAGGSLTVEPVRQGGDGASAVVWLPGEPGTAPDALVHALEGAPEIRSVWVAGRRRMEVRVTAPSFHGGGLAQDLASSVDVRRLGRLRHGTRQGAVTVGPLPGEDPGRRVLQRSGAALPVRSMGRTELRREEPELTARVNGRPGRVLLLFREYDASPLDFSRAVDRELARSGLLDDAEILVDEAEPLRTLLRRSAWGVGTAALLVFLLQAALVGPRRAWPRLLVLPVALAASLNAAWLSGLSLDVTTLPALVVALGSALLFQVLRIGLRRPWPLVWIALAAGCLPVAVVLVGGPLGAFLGAPARLFAVCAPAACLATWLVPSVGGPRPAWARRCLRFTLRRPWAVLLGGATLCYGLFVVFGSALAPRPGRLTAALDDVTLSLRFAEGSTLAEAEREVAQVEEHLAGREEVVSHWSVVYPHQAFVGLDLRPEDRTWVRMSSFAARLEAQLSHIGASLSARPLAGSGGSRPIRFDEDLEDRAETDREMTFYRMVLRSTDLQDLRVAYASLLESFATGYWRPTSEMILPDWGEPTPRVELVPLPGIDEARIERAVKALGRRTTLAAPRSVARLPGTEQEVAVRYLADDAPEDERWAPTREDLAEIRLPVGHEEAVSPLELFRVREGLTSPTIKRQGGTFVLPITVRFLYLAYGQRPTARASIDSTARRARLPAGVSLERPVLRQSRWTPERKRLLAIASALPLLLLGLAMCRLGSVPLGFACTAPVVLGAAVAAVAARWLRGHVDEMMLLTLIAALTACVPLAVEAAAAVRVERPSPLAAARGYRWLMRRLPAAAAAGAGWWALFGVPAWGLEPERFPWAPAYSVAAVVGPASILGSFFLLPVLLRSVDLVRLRDAEQAALRASPPAWREPQGPVSLSARHLCKVYGNGFQALRSLDFHLEPGIIGLLGPNGAGKTTLLRTLCGLLEPSRGQVLFRGEPVLPENRPEYRRMVGFLPQSFNAYDEISVHDFLDYWALEIGLRDTRSRRAEIERVLDQVGLAESAGKKVRNLSGGMRRRIGIARALLGSPPILIVDEPTTGLDVESRNRLRESLLSVAGERIILFSTHIASDVAATASRILLMNEGRLLFDGSAGELIQEAHGRVFECLVPDAELRELSKRYRVTTRIRTLEGIRARAVAGAHQDPAGAIVRPNLEEAYLAKLDLAPQGEGRRREGSLLDLGA